MEVTLLTVLFSTVALYQSLQPI